MHVHKARIIARDIISGDLRPTEKMMRDCKDRLNFMVKKFGPDGAKSDKDLLDRIDQLNSTDR